MTAKQWFSLRMILKECGISLVVLKKRELSKLFLVSNENLSLDPHNICFISIDSLDFFFKNLNQSIFLNFSSLRPFIIK